MAKAKKQTMRTFEGTRKTKPFTVETTLTDGEAIEILKGGTNNPADSFNNKCADAIEITAMLAAKPSLKIKVSSNLVAWGFRIAEDTVNRVTITLPEALTSLVAHRRPVTFEVAGYPVKIMQHGENSKHCGQYMITDGNPWPNNEFYGRATPSGEWTPTRATSKEVIEAIRTFGE